MLMDEIRIDDMRGSSPSSTVMPSPDNRYCVIGSEQSDLASGGNICFDEGATAIGTDVVDSHTQQPIECGSEAPTVPS